MTKIVVLAKHVPDATADRRFDPADNTVDRAGVDGLLSELDEHAIEAALTLAESVDEGSVTVLTVGPEPAANAVKKALQMGADAGVHVVDDAIHGSDAVATSLVIAQALQRVGDYDLVVAGMASTDGGTSLVPAMLAERLDLPQLTFASELSLGEGKISVRRDDETASQLVEAALPAVVSVTDAANEPRYPSFKQIMAAKKKTVETWSLAELGIDAGAVGLGAAWTEVMSFETLPPRSKGTIVTDEGDGAQSLVAFLAENKFV